MSPSPRTLDWSDAVREDGSKERDRFLQSHVDLVRYLALRIASRLPASVEFEDLVHDGYSLVYLLLGDDEGRGENHGVENRHKIDPLLEIPQLIFLS